MNVKFDKNILYIYILNVYVYWVDSIEKNIWYLDFLGMVDDYFLVYLVWRYYCLKEKKIWWVLLSN